MGCVDARDAISGEWVGEAVFGGHDEQHLATFFGPQLSVIRVRLGVQKIARSHSAIARMKAARQDIAFLGTGVVMRGKPRARRDVEEQRRVTCRAIDGKHFHPDTWYRVRQPIGVSRESEGESSWDRGPGKAGHQTLFHLRPWGSAAGREAGKRQRQRLVEFDHVRPRIVSH